MRKAEYIEREVGGGEKKVKINTEGEENEEGKGIGEKKEKNGYGGEKKGD